MKEIDWTEAHRREVWARTQELSAEVIRSGRNDVGGGAICGHESVFRWSLRCVMKFDNARIDREVRRVDGLATGRLVRDVYWSVVAPTQFDTSGILRSDEFSDEECARRVRTNWIVIGRAARLLRVTRIRRRTS